VFGDSAHHGDFAFCIFGFHLTSFDQAFVNLDALLDFALGALSELIWAELCCLVLHWVRDSGTTHRVWGYEVASATITLKCCGTGTKTRWCQNEFGTLFGTLFGTIGTDSVKIVNLEFVMDVGEDIESLVAARGELFSIDCGVRQFSQFECEVCDLVRGD
jgi:hypothetical protein